jgi:hypothetical protein
VAQQIDLKVGDLQGIRLPLAAVDFSNLCPILQQLMSNWSIARGFRPISATQSTARADTRAATMLAVARATDDPLERRRRVKRFGDLASIYPLDGRSPQYGTSP